MEVTTTPMTMDPAITATHQLDTLVTLLLAALLVIPMVERSKWINGWADEPCRTTRVLTLFQEYGWLFG